MIVLHGVIDIAGAAAIFTMSLDNKGYEVISKKESLHDNTIYENMSPLAKTDGTSAGEGSIIKVDIITSNIDNLILKKGHCTGEKNTLLSAGGGALKKEDYLAEAAAFLRTGRVDFSMSSVGYNSPMDGAVFGTWLTDKPEEGFELAENEEQELSVTITKEGNNYFVLEYDTKTVVEVPEDCDWFVARTMELKVDVHTESGIIVPDQDLVYSHHDAPIASYVNMEKGSYLTFDNDVATLGGWWESSNIPVRTRQVASSGMSTRDSMFRYMIFGMISPKVFSSSIRNMIFTAIRTGDQYIMDKVLANNLYICPPLSGLSIVSSGPQISGSAFIIPDDEAGTISIDTSNVSTGSGEMHIEISSPLSSNSCKFQLKAGFAPTAQFLVAAVDSRVLYNQITGYGTTGVTGANVDNNLVSFHLFVNGLQEPLLELTWNPSSMAFAMMTMGISCAFTGNMTDFVFFLFYESTKKILWGAERRIVMGEITRTQEHYLSSMSLAQQGVDAGTRKKIARQWLEMIDSQYMKMSGPNIQRTFFLEFGCALIPMDMPDSIPYTLGLPMYGVPMGEGILDAVNTPNHIMTDDVHAMMKKNVQFSMYRTRMDWAMAVQGNLKKFSTYWAWGGTYVAVSIGGKLQELYAASDEAYALNGAEHVSSNGPITEDVAIPGEIGEAWNEFVGAREPTPRFTYWNGQERVAGTSAEAAISEWRNDAVPVMHGLVSSVIINLDDSTVTLDGYITRDAIIYRPNPNVILAFAKPE